MKMRQAAFLLLTFCLALPAAAAVAAGPRIAVEGEDFDFGQVFQGARVEHTFRFRNVGDAPLIVEKVQSSCGCTAALVSATTIPPGEGGEVRATFDSGRFRGQVAKTIHLYLNDPLQPVARFQLRGTVRPEVLLEPEQVDLGLMTAGATRQVAVTLRNQGEENLSLAVQTTAPEIRAELSRTSLPPGGEARLTVRATPKAGRDRLSGYVLIRTGSPRVPELRLPVYGSLASR